MGGGGSGEGARTVRAGELRRVRDERAGEDARAEGGGELRRVRCERAGEGARIEGGLIHSVRTAS